MSGRRRRYRKRPEIIEAVRFTGKNIETVKSFLGDQFQMHPIHNRPIIRTMRGDLLVSKEMYIVKQVDGSFMTMEPMPFRRMYERVQD